MLDRADIEGAVLASAAAILAFVLFAEGYLAPASEGWRLYAGAIGLFAVLRAVEWSARRATAE